MALKRKLKARKSCVVGKHEDVRVLSEHPPLYRCQVCMHFLGEPSGVTNYGPDRPML